MAIEFRCVCSIHYRVDQKYAGKQTKCPACGVVMMVPLDTPPPLNDRWYCRICDTEQGPYSSAKLRGLANEGALLPNHLVRKGSAGKWVPASRIKNLFDGRTAPASQNDTYAIARDHSPPNQTTPPENRPKAKCSSCGEELRDILIAGRATDRTLCVSCSPPDGVCPECGKKLRTNKACQCPHCMASWHGVQPSNALRKGTVSSSKCMTCRQKLRNILSEEKATGKTLCVMCHPPNGVCPECGQKLLARESQNCLRCKASWHGDSEENSPEDDEPSDGSAGEKAGGVAADVAVDFILGALFGG